LGTSRLAGIRPPVSPDPVCAIAAATTVLGDRWSWLVLREVARGHRRFEDLVRELRISRKVLAERLRHLVASGVLEPVAYQSRPVRHDYALTAAGQALIPVLVGLQDWGDRWLLGDGEVSATTEPDSADAGRVRDLIGTPVPPIRLPATRGGGDVVDETARATVVFLYPATGAPTPLPEGWSAVPGAAGCTLENRLFRDRRGEFAAASLAVHGVSTQRREEQRAFAAIEDIPFPLLSDAALELTAALRLPTVRVADTLRLRRAVLVVGPDRVVQAVRYPVLDIPEAVSWSLERASALPEPAAR
jgi:DNA-binding HxlR family transcriptional regulator/peroxiredoxin